LALWFRRLFSKFSYCYFLYPTQPKINNIKLRELDPIQSTPFVQEALQELRKAVSHTDTAVLGFVGCPYTLATYLVEGKSSKDYLLIKQMMLNEPQLLHAILQHLTTQIAQYAIYQIDSGAQLIQIFDSWAGHLSPYDYDTFAAPYQKQILDTIKATHPTVPTVLYIKHSGALIERMAATGVDVVSLDWTVDMTTGRNLIDQGRFDAGIVTLEQYEQQLHRGGVQGNLDPAILYAKDQSVIYDRTIEILQKAGPMGHVMNLGHGIEATTPEENAAYFIETVRNYRHTTSN
jgi:uroporphyrinogen decarboxylase